MRVLILGATGLIGDKFYKKFINIKNTNKSDLDIIGTFLTIPVENFLQVDIRDTGKVHDIFSTFRPDIVVQPAALSNVEFCEENPEEAKEINIDATKAVVGLCKDFGSKYIFFSTDYLFDGKTGNYTEEDRPNPINVYGKTKLFMEEYIRENLADYLIIRTTIVYGWEVKGKNFVINLINKLSQGVSLKVPSDQKGNPTYALNLAEIVIELIMNQKTGIYNVVGEVSMDRYSFGRLVCDIFHLDSKLLVPVKTALLGQKADRPLNSTLNISKLKKDIKLKIIGPEEGLGLMYNERLKNIK